MVAYGLCDLLGEGYLVPIALYHSYRICGDAMQPGKRLILCIS